jgi:hypothetical protein
LIKKSRTIKDSLSNYDYNFNDELIDEHIGVSMTPSMISLRGQGMDMLINSSSREMQVLKNISNTEVRKIGEKKRRDGKDKYVYDNTQ